MAGLQMRPAGSDPIFDRVAGQLVVDALASREEGYLQEKVLPTFSAPENITVNGKSFPNIPAIGRILGGSFKFDIDRIAGFENASHLSLGGDQRQQAGGQEISEEFHG